MPVIPDIPKQQTSTHQCTCCKKYYPSSFFTKTWNEFYDGTLPICNDCISEKIKAHNYDWEYIDKVCMWAGIPFIVKEWDRVKAITLENETWGTYAKTFGGEEYRSLGWGDYYKQYKRLKEVGLIEEELPEIREQRYIELRHKWGENYDDEELNYLEDLYKGILNTQNVSGALQVDQAQKLCKISLQVNNMIRAGDKDIDKFLGSYDKIVKAAEFTPKNTKNATDFDSFAEMAYWLEKHGYINKFYDNVTRDVLDETLKNIENYNQRLYINEGGIGEEITQRAHMLKQDDSQEDNHYGLQQEFDNDEYENDAYVIDEDFDAGGME